MHAFIYRSYPSRCNTASRHFWQNPYGKAKLSVPMVLALFIGGTKLVSPPVAGQSLPPRQMERLNRGLIAVPCDGGVLVSWRLLGDDPVDIGFHVYRHTDGPPECLTSQPLTTVTNYVDNTADVGRKNGYFVRPVVGLVELPASETTWALSQPYLSIPLQTLPGHTPNDASVGDLNGDGRYEIVLKQEQMPRDNSHAGMTGQTKLEAYTLDGHFLWRIDLGPNIREGAHYTPFLVFDFDGDGRAEVACRTADGTIDGQGQIIGDPTADHRNPEGRILRGPEYLTIFEGATGRALQTVDYIPPRGNVRAWGDDYGNRSDRFLACVAYLDGTRPSLVMCRGYYTRTVLAAWNWRDGQLSHLWTFDSDDGTPGNLAYRGQGNHNLCVGDVDGDGKDEIVHGACCIDDDGSGLYSTGRGHGDASHLADIDPDRPGLELLTIHERPTHPHGLELSDAATGQVLWSARSPDVGRGLTLDLDPRYRGYECWGVGAGLDHLFDCRGNAIGARPRPCNMAVWWDGDLLRELLDGTHIDKWNHLTGRTERLLTTDQCASNNGSKANPCLCADILGDWREEVIYRTRNNRELRVYVTTFSTSHRFVTLMHDPVYRLGIATQNVGYNQPAHTGFHLGEGMPEPRRTALYYPGGHPPHPWE